MDTRVSTTTLQCVFFRRGHSSSSIHKVPAIDEKHNIDVVKHVAMHLAHQMNMLDVYLQTVFAKAHWTNPTTMGP
jgi:hypothetical protein